MCPLFPLSQEGAGWRRLSTRANVGDGRWKRVKEGYEGWPFGGKPEGWWLLGGCEGVCADGVRWQAERRRRSFRLALAERFANGARRPGRRWRLPERSETLSGWIGGVRLPARWCGEVAVDVRGPLRRRGGPRRQGFEDGVKEGSRGARGAPWWSRWRSGGVWWLSCGGLWW